METNQLPRRSERHKRKETSSQLHTAFVLGACWTLFTLTPEPWRSPAAYIIIGIVAIYLCSIRCIYYHRIVLLDDHVDQQHQKNKMV